MGSNDDDREPWLRLDADFLSDGAVAMLKQSYGPIAVATWTGLLAMTKQQQRLGDVTTSIADMAGAIGDRDVLDQLEQRRKMWQAMVDLKLVRVVDGDLDGEVTLHVLSWRSKQTMTNAEKQRLKRLRQREQAAPPVTVESDTKVVSLTPNPVSPTPKTPVSTHRQETGEEETIGTNVPHPADGEAVGALFDPPPAQPADPSEGTLPIKVVREVFEWWRQLFNVNAQAVLDGKREARIRWAWKHYGRDGLGQCLLGYARHDDWPHRHSGMRTYDLTLLLRDAQHVEAGIEKYALANGTKAKVDQQQVSASATADRALQEAGY